MALTQTLLKHKWLTILTGIAVLGGGYYWYRSTHVAQAATRYGFASVEKGTIVNSVAGTGQVAGYRQLDVKPSVSGKITKVLVKVGDTVKTGTPLLEIDRKAALKTVRDAAQSVRDSELSLQSAQLDAKKATLPPDAVSLIQARDSLAKAQRDLATLLAGPTDFELKQAQADVDTAAKNVKMATDGVTPQVVRDAYDTYVTALQSAEQTAEKILTDADNILGIDNANVKDGWRTQFSLLNSSAKSTATASYTSSKIQVANAKQLVMALKLTNETPTNIEMAATVLSTALSHETTLLNAMADGLLATIPSPYLSASDIDGARSSVDSNRSNLSSKVSSLVSQQKAIQQARDSYASAQINYQKALNQLDKIKQGADKDELASAQERVGEAQAQFAKLQQGPDAIDQQITQNNLSQRQSSLTSARNRLADAQEALNDYTVIAPFDGVVAKMTAQESGEASAGTITMLTSQHVASLSLNEVDAAKVHVGQKATLTFDAVEGLSLTGEVAEVSPLGTVTQGVVTYDVKVAFDSADERIKSGMSVSVSIITDVKADVLTVPNSAVKSQGEQHYVEALNASVQADATGLVESTDAPQRIMVEVGAANDSVTEIVSGLKEGDRVISQTIRPSTTPAASTAQSGLNLLRGAGGGAAAGGATFRAGGAGGFGGR